MTRDLPWWWDLVKREGVYPVPGLKGIYMIPRKITPQDTKTDLETKRRMAELKDECKDAMARLEQMDIE